MSGMRGGVIVGVWLWALSSCTCDGTSAPDVAPPPRVASPVSPSSPDAPNAPNARHKPLPPITRPLEGLPAATERGAEFRRGVSLGLFVSTRDEAQRRRHYARFLDEIVDVGATDLQLVVQWSMADVRASAVERDPSRSTDDAMLSWVIDGAQGRGLRVFLLPIVDLTRRGAGDWRGTLAPDDWDRWWASYGDYILHYAQLAQRRGVSMLAVGSELVSTEGQPERWRALIARVRAVFSGQLTYSANWDHFHPVTFWDALDVAGMTAYRTLSEEREPTEQALLQGFASMREEVDGWATTHGMRFIFTEIGYTSQVGAARDPWDYRPRPGGADPGLQLRCYRAMYRAWHDHPQLDGLYIWNWFGRGGVDDIGYTPRGKPAAEVLRHWYAAGEPPPAP